MFWKGPPFLVRTSRGWEKELFNCSAFPMSSRVEFGDRLFPSWLDSRFVCYLIQQWLSIHATVDVKYYKLYWYSPSVALPLTVALT